MHMSNHTAGKSANVAGSCRDTSHNASPHSDSLGPAARETVDIIPEHVSIGEREQLVKVNLLDDRILVIGRHVFHGTSGNVHSTFLSLSTYHLTLVCGSIVRLFGSVCRVRLRRRFGQHPYGETRTRRVALLSTGCLL